MDNDSRTDANNCFACGPDNPVGLKIRFHLDGDVCRGELTPGANHVGYDNLTHGGILFTALDDVMANWLFLRGERGVTARCELRYRVPVPVGTRLLLEGRMLKRRRKLVILQGRALRADDGEVVTECEGWFVVTDPGSSTNKAC